MRHLLQNHLVVLSLVLGAGSGLFLSVMPVEAATPLTRSACDQCEEADRFVRLQAASGDGRSPSSRQFTHPLVLSSEEWTSLLRGLHVQRQAEGLLFRDPPGPVLPAFTPEEIEYLSRMLSQAFAQVQPQELVVFGLSRQNPYHMMEITTGGWFVDGDSLHLILANYRKAAPMPSTRQLLWARPLRPDAGPHYDLVAGQYHTLVRDAGGWQGLFSSAPSELSISYQEALLGEAVGSGSPQQNSPSVSGVAPPALSLEERLRTLKQLHDQGLISDDDYRVKKQQLLDRL